MGKGKRSSRLRSKKVQRKRKEREVALLPLMIIIIIIIKIIITSGQRILTKCCIACRAVIEECIIPFAAYTAAEIPLLFSGPDNPSKLFLPVGRSRPYLIVVPWAHGSQPPNGISIGSAVFSWHVRVTNAQTDILRETSVAIGHICAIHAMWLNNNNNNKSHCNVVTDVYCILYTVYWCIQSNVKVTCLV